MIRWRFLLGRAVLVAAVLLLILWGLPRAVQFAVVRSLQVATGARVDVGSTHVGLFPPTLRMLRLQVADPRQRKEFTNLFQAEGIELALDGDALLRRRLVVREGKLAGIEIHGARDASGHLPPAPPPSPRREPSRLSRLIRGLTEEAAERAAQFADNLETVQRSQAIRQQWEGEYQQLAEKAARLERDIRDVRDQMRGVDNPLRDLPKLQRAMEQAEQVRQELVRVRRRIDQLPGDVQRDIRSLEDAKQVDLDRLAQYLPQHSEPAELGPELLGQFVRAQLAEVRAYLDSGREIADWTVTPPTAERGRGLDIALNPSPPPSVLVRRCEVSGVLRVDRDRYTMRGIVENLTTQPQRLDQPLRARLQLEGSQLVRLDYRRVYGGAEPTDQLTLHWPRLTAPAARLGDGKHLQLNVHGGPIELWVDLEAVGSEFHGRMVSRQSDTRLEAHLSDTLAATPLAQALQASLAEIRHLDVDATFAGNWRHVDVNLHTNLSDALAQGFRGAVDQQVEATRRHLATQVERQFQQQTERLQQWVDQQQESARQHVAQANAAVEELSQRLTAELSQPEAYLGRLRSTFDRPRP